MKILRFEAANIKKLKVVEIRPDGHIVEITGPNGSGKSSVLDAIFYALAGAKDIPSQPIRRGQLKAHVTLELGDVTVTRKFSKDTGTSLVAEAKNGARFPTPQRLLDEMLGKLTFDPLEFSRMDPKKQLEQIRSMVKLDVDLDKLDADNRNDFEKRTELNREIKSLDAQGFGFTFPEDTPDEEIDISKLAEELEAAGRQNAALERALSERKAIENTIRARTQHAHESRLQAERLRKNAEECDKAAEMDIAENLTDTATLEKMQLPAPTDTAEVRELINSARQINASVTKKKQQAAIFAQAKKKRDAADALTESMAARLNAKNTAIAAANMPIEGLSFGEGEVVYNGLPFDQASSAEQLRVSVAVAMAANPKLKVLRIQDGSLLDETSMKLLAKMAEDSDYQIWIERVDTSGKVGVVMEDGAVKDAVKEKATA
jgi:energy-coupling factor transporter ATP-binding protein EcfA2